MAVFESGLAGSGNIIVDSIAGDTRYVPGQTIQYYFANRFDDFYGFDPLADGFGVTGNQVNFSFLSEMRIAFSAVSNLVDINFTQVFNQTSSDFSYYGVNNLSAPGLPPGAEILAAHQFPGIFVSGNESFAPSVFNENSIAMDTAAERGGGNIAISTAIHELGHGMGLGHPSDNGNGSLTAISGTVLDDARYTLMTAQASGANAFGQAVSFMALDIAAMHHLYGANMTTHLGATSYSLTDARTARLDIDGRDGDISIGRAYYSIWDAGGADEINYSGSSRVLINLNDATLKQTLNGITDADLIALLNEVENSDAFDTLSNTVKSELTDSNRTAGGFFSQVLDSNGNAIDGGFTIANGAVIENASGSGGNDILIGNEVANRLTGNGGNDALFGGAGDDELFGGAGIDALFGGTGVDILDGGTGADKLNGGDQGDILNGGAGADILNGEQGADTINGGEGDDIIDGGASSGDILNGDGGNDTIFGGAGNDMIDGGTGIDTVDYSGFGGNIEVNLNDNGNPQTSGGGGVDTIVNVENIIGGDFADRLTGRADASEIRGGAGGDRIFGLGGDDMLFGDGANDFIQGGNGNDELHGGDGQDQLDGGSDNDMLFGGDDNSLDRLTGAAGDDMLDGGGGRDILRGDSISGSVITTGGNDVFDFNDVNDSLAGGLRDIIRDFIQGEDMIDLSDIDAIMGGPNNAFNFVGTSAFTGTAGEMRYQFGGRNTIISMDVDGDGIADMQIQLNGNIDLLANDFVL